MFKALGTFGGVDVRICLPSYERKQFRFPKSKRRRIRKKWRRNQRNFRMVTLPPVFYRIRQPALFGGYMGEYIATNQAGFDLLMEQFGRPA